MMKTENYDKKEQAELKESILRIVNCMTQDLIDLQEAVVKLNVFKGPVIEKVIKEVEVIKEVMVAVPVVQKPVPVQLTSAPIVMRMPPASILKTFNSFTTDILSVVVERDLVEISYTKNGQIARLNKEELYNTFVNLPDIFDKVTVDNCLKELGIEVKTTTLLMHFFLSQFKDYCVQKSKRPKDRLVIQKF